MRYSALLLIVAAFFVVSCRPAAAPVPISNRSLSSNDRAVTNAPLPPTKPVREMEWTTLDGQINTLTHLEGKAVILDFWATYCAPCKQEIPHLNSLLAKHGPENLQIIGLNVGGDEDRPKIDDFAKETKISYTIAFPENELNRFIFAESDAIPQTAVFDRKGVLVQKFIGYNSDIKDKLDKAVETAVSR